MISKNKNRKFFKLGKICLILMILLILSLRHGGDKGIVGYYFFCLPLIGDVGAESALQ